MTFRIIELQRRLREVGRIRIGEQVPTTKRDGTAGTRPKKLEHFRLTSRDRQVIEAAAAQWGGTARPWDGAPDGEQFEVFTEAKELPVIVPPGDMSFSQAYEQWSAGGCKVRCDGRWDHISDKACHCDPEARACDIHTRLSVMLPDLPGIGVWRLDTQGYYGAVELGGIVDLVASHSERGIMLPARLRLEQRSVKRTDNGKVVTRNFAVPVLDVDVHPLALTGGGLNHDTGEIGTGVAGALPPARNLTPAPPIDTAAAPSVAEQMAVVDQARPRALRKGASAPMPATGLKPRTAADAEAEAPAPQLPPDVVANLRDTLNALGVDARRAFLAHFGVGPAELPLERIDEAVEFVKALGPFDDEPPPGGDGSLPPVGGGEGEGVDGAVVHPESSAPGPDQQPALARTFGVKDVARLSTEVFRADYDAAPRGSKTKVVDRLRHAVTYAQTGGKATSLNQLTIDELMGVDARLRSIRSGEMVYEVDEAGVTFTLVASGSVTRVLWSDVDAAVAA